jgi:hypothetical protein
MYKSYLVEWILSVNDLLQATLFNPRGFMNDDLVYKKPRITKHGSVGGDSLESIADEHPELPSLAQAQEKQENALIEIAQVRFGIKGGAVDVTLTPLQIDLSMDEAQIFKMLLIAPEHERADQVLYALAIGNLNAAMANRILASLALLGKFKKMKID